MELVSPEQVDELVMKTFELGAVWGFILSETHADLSRSEVRARARNHIEAFKEELFDGN